MYKYILRVWRDSGKRRDEGRKFERERTMVSAFMYALSKRTSQNENLSFILPA